MNCRALLLLLLPACSAFIQVPGALPPVPEPVLSRRFTPAELASDLDALFALIEEVHPDPWTVLSRSEAATRRAALVASLDRPLLRREFQPRVAELVAALGDGHTALYAPQEEWWRDPQGAGAALPLDVAWDGAALRVRRTLVVTEGGDLGPGATLLEINGARADELFRRFLAGQSGETEAWRANSVETAFALHLWLEGLVAPFRVSFASALDASRRLTVDMDGQDWNALARGPAPGGGERWRLVRRDDGAAVLALDTLAADLDEFEDFLAATFADLHAHPPAALVVDLRRNGGGDSRLGDELLQYLTDRPWRQAARKEWKASDRYRAFLKTMLAPWLRWLPVQYLHPVGWKLWTAEPGELVVFEQDLHAPRDEPLRWRGPLAVLVGPGTFSSAASLAAAVKDCGLALLAGEPTGGVCNAFGEVLPFELPATRLRGQVSSARFVRPSGDATQRGGIEPDLRIVQAPGAAGDGVLDELVAYLLGPAHAGHGP
ncbi:MAG: hypothetical protein FJ296_08800 [Planctomycetes bacterium]|nr:hypothetical protein [Planctomycetota bacterium]